MTRRVFIPPKDRGAKGYETLIGVVHREVTILGARSRVRFDLSRTALIVFWCEWLEV